MFAIDQKKAVQNPIGPVRITLPAKVAYNRDLFQETLVNVLEELGCRACFSGADCTFQLERDLVINPSLRLATNPALTRIEASGAKATVNISDTQMAFDIKAVENILDKVFGELGCLACCSGYDITFRTELERLQSREFAV